MHGAARIWLAGLIRASVLELGRSGVRMSSMYLRV
jgi:hypothetical protein